jgi:DNA-binding NarL/FixJ family response regulator
MQKLKIVIIDDHQILIDGLVSILANYNEIEILKTFTNGNLFLVEMDELKPDIVLIDISMPIINGYELTKKIKSKYPNTKLIVLSMLGSITDIDKMLEAGISGYILKNESNIELIEAIHKVSQGKMHFSDNIVEEMIRNKNIKNSTQEIHPKLTVRELEILKLIAQEFNNAEVADKLFISERTVETHRKNMIRKFNAKSIIGLIRYAIEEKLI